ncbi:unnamed protein product [Larinioides sclopetarius]|uniref:Uncharacterized protein n=1 Tax=Larinioides sclopetarius TaxID=280406 RepID=A0AAV2ABZ3_9ARAC
MIIEKSAMSRKTTPQKRIPPINRNALSKIQTEEFVDGVDKLLRDNLENFGKASDLWIADKKKYDKPLRKEVVVDYFKWYI